MYSLNGVTKTHDSTGFGLLVSGLDASLPGPADVLMVPMKTLFTKSDVPMKTLSSSVPLVVAKMHPSLQMDPLMVSRK